MDLNKELKFLCKLKKKIGGWGGWVGWVRVDVNVEVKF